MTFEEQLAATGRLVYTNKGVSMLPLLREGRDVMVIEAVNTRDCAGSARDLDGSVPCAGSAAVNKPDCTGSARDHTVSAAGAAQLKRLDAVLFVRPHVEGRGHYVLHRILRVNGDGTYWIVGDNCISGETVPAENIIGRLTAVIRDGKNVSVKDPRYLIQVHLWCDAYPVRFAFLRGKAFVRRCGSFVKRRILKIR